MDLRAAFQACNRFGLGARPGELQQVAGDPQGWLLQQLKNPFIPPEIQTSIASGINLPMQQKQQAELREIYALQTGARFNAQVKSAQPFVERLVMFWSNHFTVSVQKPKLAGLVNRYEVEAIRPHVNGYFKDMLIAAVQHPAMLFYLDNAQSVGPTSPAGTRRQKGLNENLGREILELHTLGVNGGYTQADVIALANIITGWTLDRELRQDDDNAQIAYEFRPAWHEPGAKTLLGKVFAEDGEQEGIAALTMLAQHPATAQHIATKLARHFMSDAPPANAITALAQSFLQSNGHLPTVLQTLINLPETWQPLTKYKTPYEFALATFRLTGIELPPAKLMHSLSALNYRAFAAPSPAGYDDIAASWAAPDAVMKRIEWAHQLAKQLPAATDPMQLARQSIGPILSDNTKQTIERAASGADGIALLLVSPEFQRR